MGGQGGKLVAGRLERLARQACQFRRNAAGKFHVGIQARAHGRAAGGQLQQRRQRCRDDVLGKVQLRHIAGKFLAQGQGRGILQMGAADLDDVGKFRGLRIEGGAQLAQRRQHGVGDGQCRRHVDCGRKDIVRGLAQVDVVVRVQQARFSPQAADQLGTAVGQHFIHVHIALRAGPRLPDGQREFRVMLAGQHFIGRLRDGDGFLAIQ